MKEARFYERLEEGLVKCKLCPHECIIKPGHYGVCKARRNVDGKLIAMTYGRVTAMWNDPIEKKPLFHWNPGSYTFSISSAGCNFKCPWCQNWEISQRSIEEVTSVELRPEDVVKYAKAYRAPSISYTYNEPLIWFEYTLDVMKIAKKEGIGNVVVTNGFINEEPLRELLPYLDAANVDVKAFNEETYRKVIKGRLDVVLNTIEAMADAGVHVETTYLVIPGLNDNLEEFKALVRWQLDTLGPDAPLHISRFYPQYKYTHVSPTPIEILEKLRQTAIDEGLNYVYLGNVPGHPGEHTYCPKCGRLIIERWGFSIVEWALTEQMECKYCGAKIAIRGKYWGSTGHGRLFV